MQRSIFVPAAFLVAMLFCTISLTAQDCPCADDGLDFTNNGPCTVRISIVQSTGPCLSTGTVVVHPGQTVTLHDVCCIVEVKVEFGTVPTLCQDYGRFSVNCSVSNSPCDLPAPFGEVKVTPCGVVVD